MSKLTSQSISPAATSPWRIGIAYLAMLSLGVAIFLAIRHFGQGLEGPGTAQPVTVAAPAGGHQVDVAFHVVATLAAVISLGYVLGRAFRWIGQPPVIGEVVAGILLGPSVLGAINPAAAEWLIPSAAIDPGGKVPAALAVIAQLGIVLYMFLVGLELNLARLRQQAHAAVAISHASILVPFLLGAGLALGIYRTMAPAGVAFTSFASFMGIAMAITAFPVLARILTDSGLEKTDLGQIALSCAAADDVTAWCLLALVMGSAQAQFDAALRAVLGAVGFVLFMVFFVRPVVARLSRRFETSDEPGWTFPGILVAVLAAALTTEIIGVHAMFGSFLLGAVMPAGSRLAALLNRRLHDVATVLLLPAFFALTGLRTQIHLLSDAGAWGLTAVIIVVATVGKVGGTAAAARWTGFAWRPAVALGVLMNTRGLMEIVVLNIGLELEIITPQLFTMMVLMALATTLATSPTLGWVTSGPNRAFPRDPN